jgi:arsenite methyltransferase
MTVNVYESKKLQTITGKTIRPGGFYLTEKAVLLCCLKKGTKVLDVGCGTGATAEYLKNSHGLKTFGLDLSSSLLHQGRQRDPGLTLIRGNADRLPIRDSTFHALFCECVLSLTPDPVGVLKEFHRVLIPGGFLLLTDLYQRVPLVKQESTTTAINCCLNGAVGKDQIQVITARAGFNIFLWEDHTPLLKALAGQMVFAYGSMKKFWSFFYCGKECVNLSQKNENTKPGYYFLAAKKVS